MTLGLRWWLRGKESACSAGVTGGTRSITGSGRSPAGGQSNPLQHFHMGIPMDRGAPWPTVHERDHKELDMTEVTEHARDSLSN